MTGVARESRAFLPVWSALRDLALLCETWPTILGVAAQAKVKQYEKVF